MSKDLVGKRIFLYMNFVVEDDSIGITKKIKAQIRTLRRMGLDVTYCGYVSDGAAIFDNEDQVIFKKTYALKSGIYQRYYRRFLLIKTVNEYLKKSQAKFDYGYLRWHTFDRPFLKMLVNLKHAGAVNIIEAHAWTPDRKSDSLIGKYQIYQDNKNSKHAKEYVSLVAGMSEYDNIWGIKTVKIDNAIDLDVVTERRWNKNSDSLRIISVSNEYPYHGYDRLLKGMRNYYDAGGTRNTEVHLVGVFMESTKQLAHELQLEDKVFFHGKMFGAALDDLYSNSDLGIGALAHHRVGMFSGSSLKTKEYFAKGLPFIYGWREPAFDSSYPYALQIELCEDPLEIQPVLDFYDGIKNDDQMLINMRNFAREHYSWENEFKKVFGAL